jgi:hypothetical protein
MKEINSLFAASTVVMMGFVIATAQPVAFVTAQQDQKALAKVLVSPVSRSKAESPAPGANAIHKAKKTSIGKGPLTVSTGEPDSFWEEEIDVASDGKTNVVSDFLYNTQTGVIYAYREDDVTCANGQTARGGILDAVYTDGNKVGKTAGSGWYAVALDAGKCDAKETGVYGCKYNAAGNPTECGAATINNQTGEIALVPAQ